MLGMGQVNKLNNKQQSTSRNKESETDTSLKEQNEVNKLAEKVNSYLTGTHSSSGRGETSLQEGEQVARLTSRQTSTIRNREAVNKVGNLDLLTGPQSTSSSAKPSLKEGKEVNKVSNKLADYLTRMQ